MPIIKRYNKSYIITDTVYVSGCSKELTLNAKCPSVHYWQVPSLHSTLRSSADFS